MSDDRLRVKPMTPRLWRDMSTLFGPRGACAGCWCMWYRVPRREWEAGKGERNRRAFKRLVDRGVARGVLAYAGDRTVGWCAVGPRDTFSTLDRSRVLAPVDSSPVWSIVCLFVDRRFRRRGVSRKLVDAAVSLARDAGAGLVEAYPIDTPDEKYPAAFAHTGLLSTFTAAGFREVARRSPTRPIVRRRLRRARK